MAAEKEKLVIWSNYDLDYERDFKEFIEEECPGLSEDDRVEMMYRLNDEYLDDERLNLNVQLGRPILVIADLGLWYGRRCAYHEIKSGNISDCLYSGRDDYYSTWYVDELGDLRCDGIHHDGTNRYLYRVWKDSASDSQIESLKAKLYAGTAKRSDVTRVTRRLGDEIAAVYGWKIRGRRAVA